MLIDLGIQVMAQTLLNETISNIPVTQVVPFRMSFLLQKIIFIKFKNVGNKDNCTYNISNIYYVLFLSVQSFLFQSIDSDSAVYNLTAAISLSSQYY